MSSLYSIFSISSIFLVGLLGSLTPHLSQRLNKNDDVTKTQLFRFANGFAAGTIISVAFVHSFPEGDEAIEDWQIDFPLAGLFAMIGALATFTVECFISQLLSRDENVKEKIQNDDVIIGENFSTYSAFSSTSNLINSINHNINNNYNKNAENNTANNTFIDNNNNNNIKNNLQENNKEGSDRSNPKGKYISEMFILLAGLSFHSLFVGFTLGISDDDLSLFCAILFHQFFEGIALGVRIIRSDHHHFFLHFLFSSSTPLGIFLGLIVKSSLISHSSLFDFIQCFFNSFSAGMLIFVGLVHMLFEEIQRDDVIISFPKVFAIFIGTLLGAFALSLLAYWA